MNLRTLLILVVILACLGGAYVLWSRPLGSGTQDGMPVVGERLFKDYDPSKSFVLELSKAGRKVRLERRSDLRWEIASDRNRKVRNEHLMGLVSALTRTFVDEVRVGSPEKFGLDESQRIELKVLGEDGGLLLHAYLGRSPTTAFGVSFVQLPGQSAIFVATEDLEAAAGARTEDDQRRLSTAHWYDLEILRFKREDVVEFALKRGHETVRVERVVPGPEKKTEEKKDETKTGAPKPVWWITEPESVAASSTACGEIINCCAQLFARGHADDVKPADLGLDRPVAKLRIQLRDGTAYKLILGKLLDEYGILQLEGQPEVWKIDAFYHKAFSRVLKELKQEAQIDHAPAPEVKPVLPAVPVAPPIVRQEIPDPPPVDETPAYSIPKSPLRVLRP